MSNHYQVAVIGSGPGGYVAALKAGAMGASVAVIEKHHLGGTCLNYGCIPSKALLSSAELLHNIGHSADWGITASSVAFDWAKIQARKDKVLAANRSGISSLFKGRKVTHLQGFGKLDGPNKVAVLSDKNEAQTITADSVILATGTVPVRIPGWPADPNIVCTSDEAVHWSTLPKKLLIVGGGVIGCEFACMMQAFGVQVTIVELMPHLLPTLDRDLGDALAAIFKKRGITILTDVKVNEMKLAGVGVTALLSNGSNIDADRVLVSVGRKPNSGDLGLSSANIATSNRGFITVNDSMQTNVKNHYCIGDANGRCLLAHAASAHGMVAVENALGHTQAFDAPIPGAVYTFPEIGAVGMTEQEANEKNVPISIGKFPLMRLGKAMATNHTDGFVKMIRHRET
ncbi:MAG TPA: dihydrolipoyl dehydrogenase, partial [Tepidisphaeraceae bacterium]|nr:dihydrolipoyl dehydrogenase [Tepidisphaeraceae bacterium]